MALPYDPQIVEIENSNVTRLPEKYKETNLAIIGQSAGLQTKLAISFLTLFC